jgi:hypothetical protein
MKTKRQKPYWEMSRDELREATKEFDGPVDLAKTRPLSKKERAEWERMSSGPAYSIRVYGGKKRAVTIRLDEDLISWSETYAKRHKMTRDDVIARSLRSIQSFAQ